MEILDQIEMPGFNPAANQGRGEWSLRDVSQGKVTLDAVWGKPQCAEHGAMNCVNAERTLWRCLMCGRAAYSPRVAGGGR